MMDWTPLFAAIDARPFRPFKIQLVSGGPLEVTHSENIMVLPNRNRLHHIEVYKTDPFDRAIIWPEGFVGLQYPETDAPAA